jgi:hypothetical protein
MVAGNCFSLRHRAAHCIVERNVSFRLMLAVLIRLLRVGIAGTNVCPGSTSPATVQA